MAVPGDRAPAVLRAPHPRAVGLPKRARRAYTRLMHGVQRVPVQELADLIVVGEALPFRVLDALGRLLLNAGQVVANGRQLEMLVERGAWAERPLVEECRRKLQGGACAMITSVVRKRSLFDQWEHAVWDLDAVLRPLSKGQHVAPELTTLAERVDQLIGRDPDIALFAAIRQEDRRFALYPLAHSLQTAVLVHVTATQLGWVVARRRALVAAALTMNASILELQAHMAEQDTPPTARQREAIRAHPAKTVELLRSAGIDDADWLTTVAQHHEHPDGSGYPQGLKALSDDVRLLRIADVHMAKLTPRAARAPLRPQVAARQLFQQEPGSAVALALIKAIGVHPPGSLVTLKSGEVAVVKRRAADGAPAPTVCTLSDARGKPSVHSHERATHEAEHAIAGVLADTSAYSRVLPERVYGFVSA